MTAYSVWGNDGTVAIKAGLYELRIHNIYLYSTSGFWSFIPYQRYEGNTFSGGTTLAVVSQRDGAPNASATARHGTNLSLATANMRRYGIQLLPAGATWVNFETGGGQYDSKGITGQIQPTLDITIAPDHVFSVSGLTADDGYGNTRGAVIFFEELRLSWTY